MTTETILDRPGLQPQTWLDREKPAPSLKEAVELGRGIRDSVRQAARAAAEDLEAKASRLDALVHEADRIQAELQRLEGYLVTEREKIASLQASLGGDPEAALARVREALVDTAGSGLGIQPLHIDNLLRVEALARHGDAIIALARERWVAPLESRIADLQKRAREVEGSIAEESE